MAVDEQEENRKGGGASPAVCLKLPGVQVMLGGPWSFVALAILLALIAGMVYLIAAKEGPAVWASAGLWVLFIAYWSAKAKNAAPTASSEPAASRQLHQLLLYGSLLLALLPVPFLRFRWLPDALWIEVPVGLAVQVGFALLAVWARQHLGRNWSAAITKKVGHELVRTGPYRLIRHPIYTGMLGMFLGTAIVSGELHALVALLVIAAAYWRKIRLEEANLRDVFGAEYDEYRRKSWALVPPLY